MKGNITTYLILFFIFNISIFTSVEAAYYSHVPINVTQPNGVILNLFVTGDEYYRRVYDIHNYTVIQNPLTGYYVYANLVDDVLVPTNIIVGQKSVPPFDIMPGLDISPRKKLERRTAYWANVPPKENLTDNPVLPVNTTGTVNNLTVFIRFSDQSEFTQSLTVYDNMFNNTTAGYNSMYNYFQEVSYNTLSIPTTFYPTPSGTVIVSYQDSHPRGYYQPYSASNTIGYTSDLQLTTREHSLLANAVEAISSQVPTGLDIDNDDDGYVDNVCFIIRGAYDGWSDLLWPHRWVLYSQVVYINGKRVYDYTFQIENFLNSSGNGVLCHEMFHSLGAPDLYHYTDNGIDPVGSWDIMESTTNPPQSMGAWMKYKYGEWISTVPLITSPGTYTLNPVTSSTNNIYRFNAGGSSTEFFIFEYRRKTGTFENSIPGSGLIIYRINSSAGDGNAEGPPDEVYIYRPNGTLDVNGTLSTAHFSSGTGRTAFNSSTNPYPFYSNGSPAVINVNTVTAAGSTISFNIGPVADFSANAYSICVSSVIQFEDASFGSPSSWSWSFSPSTVTFVDGTSASSQNPHVQFDATGLYSVTLTVNGPYGSHTITKSGIINVFGATALPFSDNFESGSFTTNSWTVENPDHSKTWEIKSGVGGNTPGSNSPYVNFYSYNNYPQRDWLTSVPVDLSTYGSAQLTFKVAYRPYSSSYHDSLKVMIFEDCGQTWLATPYSKTGTVLATGGNLTSSYTPSSSGDWRTETISLDSHIGKTISAKFLACNGYGNNLYIDNINISGTQLVPAFIASNTTPCSNSAVLFTDQSTGGANSWLWDFGDGGTSTAQNPTHIYTTSGLFSVTLTINKGLASNFLVKTNYINVQPQTPVSVSISDNASWPVCQGSMVTFTATPSGQGSSPTYQWKVNGSNVGSNSPTYVYAPANNDQVLCVLTSSLGCTSGSPATSNTIVTNVTGVTNVTISIASEPSGAVCQGSNVTFTATPSGGGSSPAYQWKVNGNNVGTNAPTFAYAPVNNDQVLCVLTSSLGCTSGSPATSNVVVTSVTGVTNVTISIASEPSGAVCQGSNVTFTATPSGGGSSPSYQWKVNGNNVGTNSPTFVYAPANNDQVLCVLTSSLECTSGSPATSNVVVTSVTGVTNVTISIASEPSGAVCQGSSVTFTATPSGGGSSPLYQWKVNGNNVGTNAPTFAYAPANNDQVLCVLTSSLGCTSGSPATSNTVVTSVTDVTNVTVSIDAEPGGIVCEGSNVTFTATPSGGGSSPLYQWKVNGNNVGTNAPTFVYAPANNDQVLCVLTSSLSCTSGSPATSNTIITSVTGVTNVTVSIASDPSGAVCQGSNVTFTSTPSGGGSSPLYQWKVNGNNVGSNAPTFVYAPVNNDQVLCVLTSSLGCINGSPATSNVVVTSVTGVTNVTVSIEAEPGGIVCEGTSVTFTATPSGGGSSPSYQWKVNGNNVGTNAPTFAYAPVNNDQVLCVLTSSLNCINGSPATSNTIVTSVTGVTNVTVSIDAEPGGIVCEGTSVTFTATPSGGGSSPLYQWKVNGNNVGTNAPTFVYAPANNDQVLCVLTSSLGCTSGSPATSNTIVTSVTGVTNVTISIASEPSGAVCQGTSVTFTATPSGGGSSPLYQWKVNGNNVGTNAPTFTYAPANNDQVLCVLTSSLGCVSGSPATSNTIVTNVTGVTNVTVSIDAEPGGIVCEGSNVTFTATPSGGGSSPLYQWKVNGNNVGTNAPTFVYAPANNDQVLCVLTSSLGCVSGSPATSNTIVTSVTGVTNVTVSIDAEPGGIVCEGTSVTFTATPSGGGSSPLYQWKVNGNNVGTNAPTFAYAPANNDQVLCVLTSSLGCTSGSPATSNVVVTSVTGVTNVTISIASEPSGAVCQGSNVTFTATPLGGGSSPLYQWKVNGNNVGTNAPTYSYTPANNDQVLCVLTSSLGCTSVSPATSNTVVTSVTGVTNVTISIASEPSGAVCQGSNVTFTATPSGGGSSPLYQWKVNGNNVGTNAPTFAYAPANNDQVLCVLTSSLGCTSGSPATSNTIVTNVTGVTNVTVSIDAEPGGIVCEGTSVTFTATPSGGGSSPAYQWKVNGNNVGTNAPTFAYAPANNDQVLCVLTSSLGCTSGSPATSNVVVTSVTGVTNVTVSIDAEPGGIVCEGTSITFTATPSGGGSSPLYQWKVNGNNVGTNAPTFAYAPANNDQVLCVLTSSLGCTSGSPATSNVVVTSVTDVTNVTVSIDAEPGGIVCEGSNVTFTATPSGGGSSPLYQWKVNGNNVGTNAPTYSYTPANNDQVLCVLTSSLGCVSGSPATSNTIVTSVTGVTNVTVSIDAEPGGIVCEGTSITFTATPSGGGSSPLYQWKVNGNNVGTNAPTFAYAPANNDQVLCVLTSSLGCTSGSPATSNTIVTSVTGVTNVTVSIDAEPGGIVCEGSNVTFTATPSGGGSSPAYQWKVNGNNVGTNAPTFAYAPANKNQVLCVLTSSLGCTSGSPATSNVVVTSVTDVTNVTISIASEPSGAVCQGSNVTFTATPSGGGSSPVYQWKVNGNNVGTNAPTFVYAPANNDQVLCVLTSSLGCTSGSPATSNTIVTSVTGVTNVTVSIDAEPGGIVCEGTSVTFTATPSGGGSSPLYQWKVNGNNVGINAPTFVYAPANNDQVLCVLTSSLGCTSGSPATSNTIVTSVTGVTNVTVSIDAEPGGIVCEGTSVTFTATPSGGGSSPLYQWKVNGNNVGTNAPTFAYAPANNDQVLCMLTSSLGCTIGSPATSNTVVTNVTGVTNVTVSIDAEPGGIVCEGTSVTFTATPSGGGSSPAYQWKVNGNNVGTNAPTFVYAPANNDQVLCVLTSSLGCTSGSPATSNMIVTSVTGVTNVTVSIDAEPGGIVCEGTSVTFTATPSGGGSSPAYQWKVNGNNVGTNAPTFAYAPANNDQVLCVLTSSLGCTSGSPATSNTIVTSVTGVTNVTVSIDAEPGGIVCEGTSVTFTATLSGGGSSPLYQWKVNGNNVGTNAPTFAYAPANNDQVLCVLTSSLGCTSGSPATSNMIVTNVTGVTNVTISIASEPSGAVCQGSNVTFTATPSGGGSSPLYQWKVNGNNLGTNAPTFVYAPANNDQVLCVLTSSLGCVSGSPATSNVVVTSVTGVTNVTISIASEPSGAVCQGSNVTFTATPSGGGSSPLYQWKVNGNNVGTNAPTFVYAPANNDQVLCVLTSSLGCTSGSPATSNMIVTNVTGVTNVTISIASEPSGAVCQGSNVTFTATPSGGGSSPLYQWKVNGNNVGTNAPTFAYAPANNDQVLCVLTSSLNCINGSPATSNTIVTSVTGVTNVTVSIASEPSGAVCQGSNVTFTATPSGGGSSPLYQWKVNGNNVGTNAPTFVYAPANNDQVLCVLTSSLGCTSGSPATSNVVVTSVTGVTNVTVSVVAEPGGIVCQGSNVTFTATPSGGGSSPLYQWKVNGNNVGTNAPTFAYAPANNDQVLCVLTSSLGCTSGSPATSNVVVTSVTDVTNVTISIASEPSGAVCQGSNVTFTATPSGGGSSPLYQWKVNGNNVGTNAPTFAYAPANNDQVLCVLTSSLNCINGSPATSNTIVTSVTGVTNVTVSIASEPSGAVCQGSNVTFTATPSGGGSSPLYQWKVNGNNVGTNAPTFVYAPANNDQVLCVLTSSLGCTSGSPATSNVVVTSVTGVTNVTVSIDAEPGGIVCEGTSVTFTATPSGGGSSPLYQWKVNGNNVGTNAPTFAYAPANNDQVLCVLTSSLSCTSGSPATSNVVVTSVTNVTNVTISIASEPSGAVCQGSNVTFTATPSGGGSSPAYQWKVNGNNVGSNAPTFVYAPANNDQVLCVLTSSLGCTSGSPATSNVVVTSVTDVTISIASEPSGAVCQGSNVTFTATPSGGGSSPLYQWKVNGNNVGTNTPTFVYAPANNDQVLCVLTSSLGCTSGSPATSNVVVTSVTGVTNVTISIASEPSGAVCQGINVTFTATPSGGGSSPLYQWKVNGNNVGTNAPTFAYAPANNDQVLCVLTSSLGCTSGSPATSNVVVTSVTGVTNVTISIASEPSGAVCQGINVTFTATPSGGGSSPLYQWKVNGNNVGTNAPTFAYAPANNDQVLCMLTSSLGCTSGSPATSNVVVTSVTGVTNVTISIASEPSGAVCQGTSVTFTATPSGGGSSPLYQWKVNGNNVGTNTPTFAYAPANNDQVLCVLTSSLGCTSGSPATSNVVVTSVTGVTNVTISIASEPSGAVCQGSNVTFTATPSGGGSSPLYQWKVNGNNVGTNAPTFAYAPANNDQVLCVLTSSLGCTNGSPATSNVVVTSVTGVTNVTISIASEPSGAVCQGNNVTFTATPSGGGSSPLYQWKVNGNNVGTNAPTFVYAPANNDQVLCMLTSSLGCTSGSPATSNIILSQVQPNVNVGIFISHYPFGQICEGTPVIYTAYTQNAGPDPIFQWRVNGVNTGTNSSFFVYTPNNEDLVQCELTSSLPCTNNNPALSNTILASVTSPTPVNVIISASPSSSVCEGAYVTFVAYSSTGGNNPVYQWKLNGNNIGGNNPTLTIFPSNGDVINCILTSNMSCITNNPDTSNSIVMAVHPIPETDLGNDTIIPLNSTLILDAGYGFSSYLWNTGETTQEITVNTSGTYSVTVSNTFQCSGYDSINVQIGYNSLSGIVYYDNTDLTAISNATVTLKQGNTGVYSAVTNNYGQYYFPNINFGNYSVEVTSNHAWGGVNTTDALIIMRHFVGMIHLTGLRLSAANVDNNNFINASDALITAQRFVAIINYFPAGNWIFENPTIFINGSSQTIQNIKGICVGDVDGSFNP
ncbi:MAG: PKD domain-containing protein [Bacteroidales bacterium]